METNSTGKNRTALLTVKFHPNDLEEFRIAATLRGATMSSLIHQFVYRIIREEREAVPQAFERRTEHVQRRPISDLLSDRDRTS